MKNKKYFIYGGIALAVIIFFFFLSIIYKGIQQKAGEKMVEKVVSDSTNGKVNMDLGKGSVKYENKETGETMEINQKGTKIPEEWPKEISLYGNLKPTKIVKTSNSVNFSTETTETDVKKISAWYKNEFLKNGWKEEESNFVMGSFMGTYSKNNKKIIIAVIPDQTGEGIIITHQCQF